MSDSNTGKGGGPSPFVNAFDAPAIGSLRYNTAQAGSVVPNQPVVGYSGTAYVTGTPLALGASPALPNLSFEITGLQQGTAGPDFPDDARPDAIVTDLLTNPRYGAGFPPGNLDTAGAL